MTDWIENTAKIIDRIIASASMTHEADWDGMLKESAEEIFNQPFPDLPCPSTSCKDGLNIQYDGSTNPNNKCDLCHGTGHPSILQALKCLNDDCEFGKRS